MNAMIPRKPFAERFAAAASVAPTRSPKAILQQCKLTIDADGDGTLTATDLEVGITLDVPGCKASEPGSVILPTRRFGDILTRSADDELSLSVDGNTIVVRGLRSEFKLPADDPALFPEVPPSPQGPTVVLASDLRRLVKLTSYATDVASPRFALGGVLAAIESNALAFVGTDGRRLAKAIAPLDPATTLIDTGQPASLPGTPVIPLKTLKLIERTIDGDGPVYLAFTTQAVWLWTAGQTIYSRLVEGRYPRYQDVFPSNPTSTARTTAGALLSALNQAAIVTSEESRGIDLTFGDGLLTLAGMAADVGASRVMLDIAHDGPPVAVSVDPRYLADALKALPDDAEVKVELIDAKNAIVLKADDFTYVVMPLTRDR